MKESAVNLRGWILRTRSEEWVFERAIRGDAIAFSEVYRRYHSRLHGFCLSRLLDQTLAEEATQETFVRLLTSDPDAVRRPRPWLFGIAKNVCLELGRQRWETVHADSHEQATSPDCAEELFRQEQGRNIILALRKMRPRYRTALVLRELHGLSSVEIADALNTTPGAVDTLVCRSRDAFGRAYAQVSDLPSSCAQSLPLIYKRHGSGLTENEDARLRAHLDGCPECRREARRAGGNQMLAAVLPLVAGLGTDASGASLSQMLKAFDPSLATTPYAVVPTDHAWAKTATTVALLATLLLPAKASILGLFETPPHSACRRPEAGRALGGEHPRSERSGASAEEGADDRDDSRGAWWAWRHDRGSHATRRRATGESKRVALRLSVSGQGKGSRGVHEHDVAKPARTHSERVTRHASAAKRVQRRCSSDMGASSVRRIRMTGSLRGSTARRHPTSIRAASTRTTRVRQHSKTSRSSPHASKHVRFKRL